jgi:hypothetical protein
MQMVESSILMRKATANRTQPARSMLTGAQNPRGIKARRAP